MCVLLLRLMHACVLLVPRPESSKLSAGCTRPCVSFDCGRFGGSADITWTWQAGLQRVCSLGIGILLVATVPLRRGMVSGREDENKE